MVHALRFRCAVVAMLAAARQVGGQAVPGPVALALPPVHLSRSPSPLLYGRLAIGDGAEEVGLDGDLNGYSDAVHKLSAQVGAGLTVLGRGRAGGEFFVWRYAHPGESLAETFQAYLVRLGFRPVRRWAGDIEAGVGVGRSGQTLGAAGTSYMTGVAWSVGMGWNVDLSRLLSIGPLVDYYQLRLGDAPEAETERVLFIGVSASMHTPRPR